jgi:hypothetical protein
MFQTSAGTQHAKRAGAPVWSIVPPIWSSKSRSASPWHDERRSETRLSAAAGGGRLRGADMPMSAEECRAHAETCERMAQSLGPGKCRPPRCHARGRRSVASARGGRRGQGASQFKLTHYPPSAADADFSGAGLRVRIRFPPAESPLRTCPARQLAKRSPVSRRSQKSNSNVSRGHCHGNPVGSQGRIG